MCTARENWIPSFFFVYIVLDRVANCIRFSFLYLDKFLFEKNKKKRKGKRIFSFRRNVNNTLELFSIFRKEKCHIITNTHVISRLVYYRRKKCGIFRYSTYQWQKKRDEDRVYVCEARSWARKPVDGHLLLARYLQKRKKKEKERKGET